MNPCPRHGHTGPLLAIMHYLNRDSFEIPTAFNWDTLKVRAAECSACPSCLEIARRGPCFGHINANSTANGKISLVWKSCQGGVMATGTLEPDSVNGVKLVERTTDSEPCRQTNLPFAAASAPA